MLSAMGPSIDQEEDAIYLAFRDKIVSIVNEKLPFDPVLFNDMTIEKLRMKANHGQDRDKSLIWWLAWAALNGRAEIFELALLKYENEFTLTDFLQQAENEPNTGISPILLLAHTAKSRPRLFNWIWQKWEDKISASHLRSKAECGALKNISLLHAMIIAAHENKIKKEIIEKILGVIPDVCNNEDLSCQPLHEKTLGDFIQYMISLNSDWGVKLKRMISARNKFFEGILSLTPQATTFDFTKLEQLAQSAYDEGYRPALEDSDVLILIINSAQRNDWSVVYRLLTQNHTNTSIVNESLYNTLSKVAKKQGNLLAKNQINLCFTRDKLFTQEDYSDEFESLKHFETRFKPAASFVSHALIKRDSENRPSFAHQYLFATAPKDVPNIAKLQNIQCLSNNNNPTYEATTESNQKMVSTDHFNIEVQMKVGAEFVCEKYDLVFFAPKNDRGHEQGVFGFEQFPLFKTELQTALDDKTDEECPIIRLGERNISIDDMHMRQSYHNQNKLKEKEQVGQSKSLQGRAIDLYKEFYLFFSTLFTEKMMQVAKKTVDGLNHFTPEVLHAIAKQFHRPSEKHYDAKNLAIAPKWVNSLMMVIESTIRWHVVHSPFAQFNIKTIFKTFPMRHVLKEGRMEGTLKKGDCEVKISKELQPYQKFPTFPRISDITQTTFALNSLLHGRKSETIPFIALTEQRVVTVQYDLRPQEPVAQPTHDIAPLKKLTYQ